MTESDPQSEGPLALDTETVVRGGGARGRIGALIAGGALLIGGVGFAATQLGSDDGSPEQALTELFDAIENEDVLGAMAALDPGERETLRGPTEAMYEQLQRLEVLGDDFRLDGVSGIDIEFDGMQFRSEPIRDDLARVYLVGGTGTASFDTDELALGDFLTDTLDRFDVTYRGMSDSDSTTFPEAGGENDFVVARKGADGWRISLGYTIAEQARLDSAAGPAPAVGTGLTPIGADSPEAAVEGFLRTALDFDVEGLVARLSPNEFAALQDYWRLFVDPADLPPGPEELGISLELRSIDLRSTSSGGTASVFVDGFDLAVSADGVDFGVTFADGCAEVTGDLSPFGFEDLPEGPFCASDYASSFDEATAGLGLDDLGIDVDLSVFESVRTPALGITTHRVGGDWYLAPISTYLDGSVALLSAVDRVHLEAMVDLVEQGVDAFTQSFLGTGFGSDFGTDPGTIDFDGGIGFIDPSTIDAQTRADVVALLESFAENADAAACSYDILLNILTAEQFDELVGFARGGPQPTFSSEDTVFFALDICQG